MSPVTVRRFLRLSLSALVVGASLAPALGQSLPEREISRDLLRRALLDACVYAEAAKEDAKKDKVADACQCAANKAMKPIKEEDVANVVKTKAIPDAWYGATTEAYAGCVR